MAQISSRRSYRARWYRGLVAAQTRFVRRRAPLPGVFFEYPPLLSPADELANGLTHGVAAVVSLAGAVWLIAAAAQRGSALMTLACASFAVSLTGVFTMSALSHVVGLPRLRQFFRTLDQAAIYLLTAGSASPFFVRYLLPQGWGWMLPAMWGIALYATWVKLRGHRVNSVSVGFNVAMGWFPVVAAKPMLTSMPAGCTALVVASGTLYMLGVVFLCHDERRRYFHAVWHLLVVAASACTYAAILLYVI
jgi:hemolysin III